MSRVSAIPETLIIELTNNCNLHCPLCSTSTSMKRPRGFMKLELFRDIVDECAGHGSRPLLSMNMCGEPLLHPRVDECVSYASGKGFDTFISTNVTMLKAELSEKLLTAGLGSIHLCIDGATARAHESYRKGSSFTEVRENARVFSELKRRVKGRTKIVIQTLLTVYSEGEKDQVIQWADEIGADEVFFKTLSLGSHTSEEVKEKYAYLLPSQRENRRTERSGVSVGDTGFCTRPEEHLMIFQDGSLGICCIDFNNAENLPSVKENGLIRTLENDLVQEKRALGKKRSLALCSACSASVKEPGIHTPLKGNTMSRGKS